MDNAGNPSLVCNDTIVLDTTVPIGTISIDSGATYTNTTSVTLALSASDSGSGVKEFRLSNDGVTWGSWESWQNLSSSMIWNLPSGDGQKKVFFQIMDNASNVKTCNDTIVLDTTPAEFAFGIASNVDFTGSSATVNWSANDSNGIVGYEYSLDGASFISNGLTTHIDLTNLTTGSHNLTVRAIDGAGNVVEKKLQFNIVAAGSSMGGLMPWLLVIVAIVAIMLLLFFLLRRRKGEKKSPVEAPPVPPPSSSPIERVQEKHLSPDG
jgi:hypothetical protein